MIRTIVFDFGNVIGFFDHCRATQRLAQYGDLPSEAIHAYLFGGSLEDAYEAGQLSSADYRARVQDHCGLRCSEEEFAAAYGDIFWPNPDVCGLVPALKPKYRLLLGSNTTELHARWFRRQFADVLALFDGLVLSCEIGVRKPAAGFYDHCRGLAGCPAGECVFIDDLPNNVAGARSCGWHGIVYGQATDLRRELAALGVQVDSPAGSRLLSANGPGLQWHQIGHEPIDPSSRGDS